MLPAIKENTAYRLDNSRNFTFYKKVLDGYRPPVKKRVTRKSFRESNFGVVDLQIQEGVNILKDMMYLQ